MCALYKPPAIIKCEICGTDTSFMRRSPDQLHEGDTCIGCEKWVCVNCVDWKKTEEAGVICKECAA